MSRTLHLGAHNSSSKRSHDAGGVSTAQNIRFDVFRHDRPRGKNRSAADADTGQNRHAGARPDTVLDGNVSRIAEPSAMLGAADGMSTGHDGTAGP